MHPALSVIVFTTLSGAGYGLLFWLGLSIVMSGTGGAAALSPLAVGSALVCAGLLASVAHLGRPERAWRAFSQWRTSWLSREGVLAVLSLAIMLALAWAIWTAATVRTQQTLALALSAISALTVWCTARIYSSLKPIPAWHNAWVLPNYLVLAAATGAVWLWSLSVLGLAPPIHRGGVVGVLMLLAAAAVLKLAYWRHIDRHRAGVDAASALALPSGSRVAPFEAPHTEANFLLKEMGFALARKHAGRLRGLTLLLLFVVPAPALLSTLLFPAARPPVAVVVVSSTMVAVLVERWLFFAQARHVVLTYYDAQPT